MARLGSIIKSPVKKLSIFLNTSFLFLLSFFLVTTIISFDHHQNPSNSLHHLIHQNLNTTTTRSPLNEPSNDDTCSPVNAFNDHKSNCEYIRSNEACSSEGYIDYLHLFYCTCGKYPLLGYTVLVLWLVLLFYLLGNTAAIYFCSSLETLSSFLKLSPTIAGVTLLSLGNGAPDVFSSLVSFAGAGTGDVGLNSVLGGALFVSTVVVGVISICVGPRQVSVDKAGFIRDVLFFLLAIGSLLVIVMVGKVNIWGALGFVALYFVYVLIVATSHLWKLGGLKLKNLIFGSPNLLPITGGLDDDDELSEPLLGYIGDDDDEKKPVLKERDRQVLDEDNEAKTRRCFCGFDSAVIWDYLGRFLYVLELPLYLPRRLTIPVVSEDKWSKPFAVASVVFSPVLLAALWNSYRENMGSRESLLVYLISALVGVGVGTIAFLTTELSNPPKRCLLPWLAGGFLMSVTWTYIIAKELVALLVSLGTISGISPSILGLTLLAWGNSLGDLIANVAMAVNGEADSVQVAISGCYAGPIFNTIIGLGLSFIFAAWSQYPSSFLIPSDPYIYETLGFLAGGLLWGLVILPRRSMRLDRILGGGLIAIYLCFLSVRLHKYL